MRISDWSSDVCSSDLVGGIATHVVEFLVQPRLGIGQVHVARVETARGGDRGGGFGEIAGAQLRARLLQQFAQRILAPLQRTGVLRLQRSEEHTSELQSLMRISYAVFCLKKKNTIIPHSKSYYYIINPKHNI